MILGYFCKSVVAGLASQLAQQLWAHLDRATVLQTQVGIIAFALEIFADYYGYISIARGVSLLFNIDLPQNFRMPIAARNLADFWRRWNITLSLWLHDYLFLPLGGSRRSWLRTVTNVLITFAVAGLWHGASWNFVIMGIFFGLIVSVYHMYRRVRSKLLGNFEQAVVNLPAYTFVSWMLTLGSIFLGAVFFRSEHVADAFTIIGRCFQFGTAACELKTCLQTGDLTILIAFLFCVICFSLEYLLRQPYELMRVRLPVWAQAQAATLVLLLCWVCSADLPQQFWYARF
jgi:D-alanyl-lipoteichoic acid acyltransferase DltB (MBOAT superfamily)